MYIDTWTKRPTLAELTPITSSQPVDPEAKAHTENGQMAYLPSAWTDAWQADPFVLLSQGRAVVRFEDLLRLVKLIEDLKQRSVKEIRPSV